MAAVATVAPDLGAIQACRALGISRATLYRRRRPPASPASRLQRPRPPRALNDAERQAVRDLLHAARFVDVAPAEVVATLLDEGTYLASERAMYRILAQAGQTGERRNQLTHPRHARPELLATRPNQLWSWDITRLLGPATWTYYYLYVILDVFSRSVVGWTVAYAEQAALAERLLAATTAKQQITPGTLTVHADRGSSMTSQAGRVPAGRPGGHQDPLPPARQQRQPLFRTSIQALEVPARLPRPVRLHPGRPRVLPAVLHLVQP
jgi:putative transposase